MYHAVSVAGTPIDNWKLEVGQCVTHIAQAMPSLVMWRAMAGGREIYGVRSFMRVDPQRDRVIDGDSVRRAAAGTSDCDECLLAATGLCPGLLGGE